MDATQQMSHYGQAYSQSETHVDTSPFVVHVEELVMVSTHEILQLRQEFVPFRDYFIGCFAYNFNNFFQLVMVHARGLCLNLNEERPILVH